MKTSHTTANTDANTTARIHSVLAIIGIVTAIICSLVLWNDQSSENMEANGLTFNKTSIGSITESIVKSNDLSVISRIESIIKF